MDETVELVAFITGRSQENTLRRLMEENEKAEHEKIPLNIFNKGRSMSFLSAINSAIERRIVVEFNQLTRAAHVSL